MAVKLMVEETSVILGQTRPAASNWQTLSHNVVSSTPHHVEESSSSGKRHWLHIDENKLIIHSQMAVP